MGWEIPAASRVAPALTGRFRISHCKPDVMSNRNRKRLLSGACGGPLLNARQTVVRKFRQISVFCAAADSLRQREKCGGEKFRLRKLPGTLPLS